MKLMNWRWLVICVVAVLLAGCKSYPTKGGAGSAGAAGQYGTGAAGAGAGGTYSEGYGSGSGGYYSINKCQPAKPVAGKDQWYYFAFDSNAVQQKYLASLRQQANYLIKHPNIKVKVAGNTDNRGSREYNIGLGWRRARAVTQILAQDGVPRRQIIPVSYGAERPFATVQTVGSRDKAWACNRRVDLMYPNRG